jgi:hypothetical protein
MKASRSIATGLLVAAALFTACNRKPWIQTRDTDAALKALGSTVPAPEYGHDFWRLEHDENSEAWRQAVKLCSESILANYPNCLPVTAIVQEDAQKQAAKEREKNAHFDEMMARGFDYDAARGLWYRESDMISRRCVYTRLSPDSLTDFKATFQCPAGTKLPKGEK